MDEKTSKSIKTSAFAGNDSEMELPEQDEVIQSESTERAEKNLSERIEAEKTSSSKPSEEGQKAIKSMTASLKGIKLKKRLSGAQKKKLTREKKMAEGTWVEKPKVKKRQNTGEPQGPASKTAKSDRPKGETYRQALTAVKMAIVPEGYPETKLSEEQALDLELKITNQIRRNPEGFAPTFLYCRLENGALIINCADLESSKWLEQTVSDINPWQEQVLLVGEARKLVRTIKIIAKLPKVCNNLEQKVILEKISAQNGGLNPTEWNVLNRKTDPSGLTIVLSVPEQDATALGKRGYKFYIGLHQVQAKVLEKSTKNDGGEASTSQPPPQ